MKKVAGLMLILALTLASAPLSAEAQGGTMTIADGSKVSFDYTLTVEGAVVDSSEGSGPLAYTHGEKQIIPGLEKELAGLKTGDEKSVTIAPKDAYGEIDSQAVRDVPLSSLPPDLKPEVGMTLGMQGPQGEPIPVKVKAMDAEKITLDLNHPLAGKTLQFKVKVVSVE